MSQQIVKEGGIIKVGKHELECVMVNWREVRDLDGAVTGEKENFVYSFRPRAELIKERKDSSNPKPKEEK